MMSIQDAARIAVEKAMGLRSDETIVIICDKKSRKIGYVLYEAAAEIAEEPVLIEIKERSSNGEEPPELVSSALLHADVALIPTTKSMSHTAARKAACDKGARIATLPGITEDMMERTLDVDYKEMEELSKKLAYLLSEGKMVEIKTEKGTHLKFSIDGRKGHPDTGICHSSGDFSNLPAGEAYIAPVEGSASGRLIIDGSLAGYGLLKEPLEVQIEGGLVTHLSGDGAEFLQDVFNRYGEKARNIAELGIGTNARAIITGNVLEDEKVRGTIHIAFGDNSTFGGNVSVDSHLDGVLKKPTLILDGQVVMKEGVSLRSN
ncbi:aminopeptidase [candidate division WOR-3 bacterium]|nr:aminopeptidase [candidate division WOR-3 bacterium]